MFTPAESWPGEWLAISSRINTWLFSLFRQTKQSSWNPNRPASPKFNLVFACGYIAKRQHRHNALGVHGPTYAEATSKLDITCVYTHDLSSLTLVRLRDPPPDDKAIRIANTIVLLPLAPLYLYTLSFSVKPSSLN